MFVYGRVGANQFEWYRGSSEFVSNTDMSVADMFVFETFLFYNFKEEKL